VCLPVVEKYLEQMEAIVKTATHEEGSSSTHIHKWRSLTTQHITHPYHTHYIKPSLTSRLTTTEQLVQMLVLNILLTCLPCHMRHLVLRQYCLVELTRTSHHCGQWLPSIHTNYNAASQQCIKVLPSTECAPN